MTPRERILAALRNQDVDYAPCMPVFSGALPSADLSWSSEAERMEALVARLGVDAFVSWGVPPGQHSGVTSRTWKEASADGRYTLLHKVFDTPAGPLSCSVRKTDDWPHGNDVPIRSDYLISRIVKPWVVDEADVDRLEYVYRPPERTDARIEEEFRPTRELAERWQVPIYSIAGSGLYANLSFLGTEGAALYSMDHPEIVERLADLEHRVCLARLDILARAGVHFVRRTGHYETTDFCSPSQIRRYTVPRFRREIERSHELGIPMVLAACTGLMPILDILRELPFDCLYDFEPALGGQDLGLLRKALGPTRSLWGGLSAPIHLEGGTPETVRRAVRDFYETCGHRGTILAPVSSVQPATPPANLAAMVQEWKRLSRG
jgi:uroporphyrinogen-III decarboxylase